MPFREVRPKEVFKSDVAPFSLATRTSSASILHISGQVPVDAEGNNVCHGDVIGQTEQIIANIRAIVEHEGGSLADVCRLVIFLTDRRQLAPVMEVRKRHFREPYPAATGVVVAGLAHPDWLVEIEATAALPPSR